MITLDLAYKTFFCGQYCTPGSVLIFYLQGTFRENPNVCICIWGFTARQHLRSLEPVMNDYRWEWWPNGIRGPWGLKLPDICLAGEEKPPKTSPRKPVPIGDRTRDRRVCYHLSPQQWTRKPDSVILLDFECSINPQNFIKIVKGSFEKKYVKYPQF